MNVRNNLPGRKQAAADQHGEVEIITSAVESKAIAIFALAITDQWSAQLASFKNKRFAHKGSCFST